MRKNCTIRVILGWLILVAFVGWLGYGLWSNYTGRLGTDMVLLPIIATIVALFVTRSYIWLGYSLPWLQCPDCNKRGLVIYKREDEQVWVHERGAFSVRFARQRKWWKTCGRCQCEFDDRTRTVVDPGEM